MAGDWIKMRGNLWDDPRIGRLVDLTDSSEAAVIGALYWLWATADQHTEDGIMPGLSLRQIDRKTGVKGMGDALVAVGWLADHPEGVRIINFEDHNGASAKRRSMDAQRKANVRSVSASEADKTQTDGGQKTPNRGAREEKRREEISPTNVGEETPRKRDAAPQVEKPSDVEQQTWADWLALRKSKKAPVTETVLAGASSEAGKAGMTLDAFLKVWCLRGSQGLEASWLKPEERSSGGRSSPASGRHTGFESKNYREGVTEDGALA